MKRLCTLIVIMFSVSAIHSQVLKTSTTYEWGDDSWQKALVGAYTYSGGCNQILVAELKAYDDSS